MRKNVSGFEEKFKKLKARARYIWFLAKKGHLRYINKEKVNYEISCFNFATFTPKLKEDICENPTEDLIISLTSFPDRMYELKYTLYSLRKQSLKPDKILLWLAKEQFPRLEEDISPELLGLINKWGIFIRWCDDIRSYKKIVYTLQDFPEDIIVTADDDWYYSPEWLEILYKSYVESGDIISHRSHKILIKDGKIQPFSKWINSISEESYSYRNLLTSGSGALFPPHSLYKDTTDIEKIKKLAPKADDVWLWAMAVMNGSKIRVPKEHISKLTAVNIDRELRLNGEYSLSIDDVEKRMNDVYIRNIIREYPEITDKVIS